MFRKRWNANCVFDFWCDYISCPGGEEPIPRAYTSDPDGALLVGQFLLLLAEAHLAGQAQPAPSTHRSQTITMMELTATGGATGLLYLLCRAPQTPEHHRGATGSLTSPHAHSAIRQMTKHSHFRWAHSQSSPLSLAVISSPGPYVLATYGTNFTAILRWCNEIKWHGHSHKGMATLMQTLGKAPCF